MTSLNVKKKRGPQTAWSFHRGPCSFCYGLLAPDLLITFS